MPKIDSEHFKQSVASVLRQTRLELKLSQTEAAGRCGIAANYLSELESGKYMPTVEVFANLALAFDIQAQDLLANVMEHYCSEP